MNPSPRVMLTTLVAASLCLGHATAADALAESRTASTTAVTSPDSPRYKFWYAIDLPWSTTDISDAAGKYTVVVLNPDRTDLANQLRRLDPQVKLLAYQDASSVRAYDGDRAVVSGVSYTQARSLGWLARDTYGNQINWPYAGHIQAGVWWPAYQEAWAANAARLVSSGPWDGILVDNDMRSLRYYSSQLVEGTSTQAESDLKIIHGLEGLTAKAGQRLNAMGKIVVPNISDSRLEAGRWARHSAYGGGMEENFLAWPTASGGPTIYDWGPTGWSTMVDQVNTGPRSLIQTGVSAADTRTKLYGFGSFLLKARPQDAWQGEDPRSTTPTFPAEADWPIGRAQGDAQKVGTIWTRSFEGAWVAVNPTMSNQTIQAPDGVHNASGAPAGQVQLGPMSAFIGRR